jgi:hypothetical protein
MFRELLQGYEFYREMKTELEIRRGLWPRIHLEDKCYKRTGKNPFTSLENSSKFKPQLFINTS